MNRASARSERFLQVERLLRSSPTPLSKAEIARRTGVNRATIGRMEEAMLAQGIPLRYDEHSRLYLDKTAYLSTIRLKQDEAVVLYLAARLLEHYSDKPNIHVANALEKLGATLHATTPVAGEYVVASSNLLHAEKPIKPTHEQIVLETLGRGWVEGRWVQLSYRPLNARRSFDQLFAPYLLEPSGIGFAVYAIGLAGNPGVLRTRKLDRIERIQLTDDHFEVPDSFNATRLLQGAWAIWFEDSDKPQPITLRFSQYVARRIRESHWHPSQHVTEDEQGRVIWTAEVDVIQEMMPWIRGWGADVEVLEPLELRTKMKNETALLARLYDSTAPDLENRQQLFDDIFND